MECYEDLANAIIERAVEDYKMAIYYLYYLKNNKYEIIQQIVERDEKLANPIHYTSVALQALYYRKVDAAKQEVLNIERFFYSQWYQTLTRVDGKTLVRRVKEQIKQQKGIDCDLL